MPEVQTGVPGQKLARRYGLKGITFAPSVEPIIVPVVLLDDLTDDEPGLAYAFVGDQIANDVAALSQTRLRNPPGSGVFLEQIILLIYLDAIAGFEVHQNGPALTNPTVELWQDFTRSGSPNGVVTDGHDVGVVSQPVFHARALANTLIAVDMPNVRLGEGDLLHALATSNNVGLRYSWRWAERSITAEEAF